jgi:hypothetical protein
VWCGQEGKGKIKDGREAASRMAFFLSRFGLRAFGGSSALVSLSSVSFPFQVVGKAKVLMVPWKR